MSDSNRERWGHLTPKEKAQRLKDEELESLRSQVRHLQAERDHWKANHDEMVQRNRLLRSRSDLPLERLQAYEQVLQQQTDLQAQIRQLREACEVAEEALSRLDPAAETRLGQAAQKISEALQATRPHPPI